MPRFELAIALRIVRTGFDMISTERAQEDFTFFVDELGAIVAVDAGLDFLRFF